jgi:hypothetical protein
VKRPENPIPTLFFDERGCGPDACDLALHPMKELEYEGKIIAKRSVGLRVFASQSGIGALMFATAGGFQLFEAEATALRDQLTAWLDAPRLEARKNPTVAHVDEKAHFCLLSTSAGEWCTAEHYGGPDPETAQWFASEDEAREAFTDATRMGWCENDWCKAYVAADTLQEEGEDGPEVCSPCYESALADFNATPAVHVEPSDCDWTGTCGDANVIVNSEDLGDSSTGITCPKCGKDLDEALTELKTGGDIDDVTEDTRG